LPPTAKKLRPTGPVRASGLWDDRYTAKPSDFRKATQRVYRTRTLPSHVSLRVLP
jgi:hypothetical protein